MEMSGSHAHLSPFPHEGPITTQRQWRGEAGSSQLGWGFRKCGFCSRTWEGSVISLSTLFTPGQGVRGKDRNSPQPSLHPV